MLLNKAESWLESREEQRHMKLIPSCAFGDPGRGILWYKSTLTYLDEMRCFPVISHLLHFPLPRLDHYEAHQHYQHT